MKINNIEGQINLFNLPIQEIIKPKAQVKEVPKENNFIQIINLYKESCNRIVKQTCGSLLVEIGERTLYFSPDGVNTMELNKEMGLLPGDEILVVNQDKKVNDLQLKKLNEMSVKKYIKRNGDANIIIPMLDQTIVINPRGWILEYIQKPIYHEDEVFITETTEKNTDLADKDTKVDINIIELQIDDFVEMEYQGIKNKGRIVRIYNNGETVNVSWDKKQTAFYYKSIKKIS